MQKTLYSPLLEKRAKNLDGFFTSYTLQNQQRIKSDLYILAAQIEVKILN
jgi:hypothetical protein